MWAYDLETLRFVNVNDAAIGHYGYNKDEFLAMTLRDIRPPEELPRLEANLAEPRQRQERSGPWMHRKKDGTLIDVEIISHDILFLDRPARLVLAHDITERKRAEQALRESEERNRAIVNAVPDLLFQVSRDGVILDYRAPDESALYAPPEVFLGKNIKDVLPAHIAQPIMDAIEESFRFNKMAMIEYELPMHGGQRFYEDRIVPLFRDRVLSVIRDITERKRAEQKLEASEKRFRALIENIYEGIVVVDAIGTIQYLSPSSSRVLGLPPEELISQNAFSLIHPEDFENVTSLFTQALQQPELRATASIRFRYADGTWRWVEAVGANAFAEPSVQGMIVTVRDITERKQAESELAKLHLAVESSGEVIFLTDREGIITYVNPEFTNLYGYTAAEVVGQTTPRTLKSGMLAPENYEGLWKTILNGQAVRGEWINKAKDGRLIEIEGSTSPIQDENGNIIGFLAIQRDMTERKRAEAEIKRRLAELEAVNQLSTAMRAAQTLDQILQVFLDVTLGVMDATVGSIWLYDPARDEVRVVITRGWVEGRTVPPEKPGEGIAGYVFASQQTLIEHDFHLSPRLPEAVRQQIPPGIGGAAIPLRAADKVIGTFNISALQPRELTPDEVHLLTILSEIAGNAIQRARLHEQTEQRLQRLDALHDIDAAINASLDLRLILKVFVDQVIARLGVDAAAVSLLNSRTHMLEYMAGRGFRTQALEQTRQRLGEGTTGRAALERRTIHIANLREAGKGFRRTALLLGEGFVTYYGVPLIAKGQVMGVLEVFQRALLEPDAEWLDFLNVLAEQAAIAIDNATLFDNLQRSNAELTMAYDATIEGWSRALDLRDKETEGHTRRVTEMTVQLARAFGLNDEELAQMRRGALLHDIGKMGIPDRILLKPGPLSDDEWVLMKMHPAFAYEMLSPIRYLRPALDIPYCHHEKWDGTGYPRGLKGEQIPRAARIFAMVDVWDALRSDRPYRPAWPEERVREHLRSLSGTHFDPQVVEAFLNLLAGRA